MFAGDVYKLLEGTADAAFVVTSGARSAPGMRPPEKLTGYAAADVLNRTCHEVSRGKGALGTVVCGGECSVHLRGRN